MIVPGSCSGSPVSSTALKKRLLGLSRCMLHDPLAAGVALDPELMRTELRHVDIELRCELWRGMSVADRRGWTPLVGSIVEVVLKIDATHFKKTFMESLHSWALEG